jgi:hypothetical protein
MSLLDSALIVFTTLQATNGIPAVVSRNGQSCSPIVVLGRTDGTAVTNREATYAEDSQDVLIAASDYQPTGAPTSPKDADQITYSDGSSNIVLEARPSGGSTQCFVRWRGGAVYRGHTKIVSRTPLS